MIRPSLGFLFLFIAIVVTLGTTLGPASFAYGAQSTGSTVALADGSGSIAVTSDLYSVGYATDTATSSIIAGAEGSGFGAYWWLIAIAILAVLGIGAWAWAGSSSEAI